MSRPQLPRSFVQIHYHNRPGGVCRVMAGYAAAFGRLAPKGATRNIVVCRDYAHGEFRDGTVELVALPAADYHEFTSGKSLEARCDRLIRRLERLLADPGLPRPVCVVGHNLTLGKNCALSMAFARLAGRYAGRDDVRFFSVAHDLPQEGRTALMRQILRLRHLGIPIDAALFPHRNIGWVVLNPRNQRLFGLAGASATLLPNPVDASFTRRPSLPGSRQLLTQALHRLARDEGIDFDPDRRTIFYPVRIIARKNIVEAVIAACLLQGANLLVGTSGTSSADRAFRDRLVELCRRFRLPVLVDCERIAPRVEYRPGVTLRREEVFAHLYRYADCCITTAVAEGFGYALYEPWVHRQPLIGRRPLGFRPIRGLSMAFLYDRFPLPLAWVDIDALADAYQQSLRRCFGLRPQIRSRTAFRTAFIRRHASDEAIDLALLDEQSQLAVLQRLLQHPEQCRHLAELKRGLDMQERQARARLAANRAAILAGLTGAAFDRRFRRCFLKAGSCGQAALRPERFERFFAALDQHRLLLAPGS